LRLAPCACVLGSLVTFVNHVTYGCMSFESRQEMRFQTVQRELQVTANHEKIMLPGDEVAPDRSKRGLKVVRHTGKSGAGTGPKRGRRCARQGDVLGDCPRALPGAARRISSISLTARLDLDDWRGCLAKSAPKLSAGKTGDGKPERIAQQAQRRCFRVFWKRSAIRKPGGDVSLIQSRTRTTWRARWSATGWKRRG